MPETPPATLPWSWCDILVTAHLWAPVTTASTISREGWVTFPRLQACAAANSQELFVPLNRALAARAGFLRALKANPSVYTL